MSQLAFVARFKSSEASRGGLTIEGWANKAVVDRGGDIINKDAWKLDNFGKNAMILYNHDRNKPIGKAVAVEPRDEGLYIKARISGSSDPEITKIRDLIREGILNTFSVGFDCKNEEKSADGHNVIKEAELFEVSVVTLPMNQDSTFTVSKKLADVKTAAIEHEAFMSKAKKEPMDIVVPEEEAHAEEAAPVEEKPAEESEPVEEKAPEMDDDTKALLDAFKADVDATMSGEGNPAAWVADEDLWAKAKEVSTAALGEVNYGFVTWYYLTHGGTKKEKEASSELETKAAIDSKPPMVDENPYLDQARQTNILLSALIMEVQKLAASVAGKAVEQPKVEVEVGEIETPAEEIESEDDQEVAKLLTVARQYFKDIDGKLKTLGC